MNIALLGAESSGKSTLARALTQELQALLGPTPTVLVVTEALRDWCEAHGRTPQAHEQAAIAHAQHQRLQAARAQWGPTAWLVADTTPLMTAVYSEHYFADGSLTEWAHGVQHGFDLTLLMGLDLPWQADGPWRDGPATQQAVDNRLRAHLLTLGRPFQTLYGQGQHRVGAALQAIAAARVPHTPPAAADAAPGQAAVAGSASVHATLAEKIKNRANYLYGISDRSLFHSSLMPVCEACSDPACERTLVTRLLSQRHQPARSIG